MRVLLLCPLDTHVQISVCAFVHSYAYTLPLFVRVGAVRCIYCYNHFSVCCVCVCVCVSVAAPQITSPLNIEIYLQVHPPLPLREELE